MARLGVTVRQTFAARSFSIAGPTLRNKLPNHIKNSNSLDIFKKKSQDISVCQW